jgi:hypothetical protein
MIHYMTTTDIARKLGKRESTVRGMHLPKPDDKAGYEPGMVRPLWRPATIEKWLNERNA